MKPGIRTWLLSACLLAGWTAFAPGCNMHAAPPTPPVKPLLPTAGSKTGKLVVKFTPPIPRRTNSYCTNGMMFTWSYRFTPPEFTTFRFYGRKQIDGPATLLGTNTRPVWVWYRTNGPVQFIACEAVDADLPKSSTGRVK